MNSFQAASSFVLAAFLVVASYAVPVHAEELGAIFANGQSVDAGVLAAQRGGTSQSIDATAIANVHDNVAIGVTGGNSFGTFGSGQGLLTAVQNTGNNVAIQTQVIVNLNLQ